MIGREEGERGEEREGGEERVIGVCVGAGDERKGARPYTEK